jgi:hypothetical protein
MTYSFERQRELPIWIARWRQCRVAEESETLDGLSP